MRESRWEGRGFRRDTEVGRRDGETHGLSRGGGRGSSWEGGGFARDADLGRRDDKTHGSGRDAREWQVTFQRQYLRSQSVWDERARKWSEATFRNRQHSSTSTTSATQGSTGGKGRGGGGNSSKGPTAAKSTSTTKAPSAATAAPGPAASSQGSSFNQTKTTTPGTQLCWRDMVLALGLTTMPYTAKAGATVARKQLEPCRQGATCDRDH